MKWNLFFVVVFIVGFLLGLEILGDSARTENNKILGICCFVISGISLLCLAIMNVKSKNIKKD